MGEAMVAAAIAVVVEQTAAAIDEAVPRGE